MWQAVTLYYEQIEQQVEYILIMHMVLIVLSFVGCRYQHFIDTF